MPVSVNNENARRFKATRAQREMFLIEQVRPEARSNLWFYKLFHGPLDLKVLANTIKHLTSTVPLLQTRFVYSDGELWQIQDQNIQYDPKTVDITTSPKPLEDALERMKGSVNQIGNMTDGNLCQFTFYIIDKDKYLLHVQFHSAFIDVRSWSKLESLIASVYNELKLGNETTVLRKLDFDAIANSDAKYQMSSELDLDKKFWQTYVDKLKRFGYTQRCINSSAKKTIYRQKLTIDTATRQKLQQATATLNISEYFLYIGASALLLRNILNREYVSLSLPVGGTNLTHDLGMTSNVLPLLLNITEDTTIHDALALITQEIKSIQKHQRYRNEDILKLANYSSNVSFGPYVNVFCNEREDRFENCSCSSYFGETDDINDLRLTFWADHPNGQLDILLEDIDEAHSEQQLAALKECLAFILEKITSESSITVAELDEKSRSILTFNFGDSFYANRSKPVAGGFLQWNRDCDTLVRLVNSSKWVGGGTSPFAVPKMLLGNYAAGIKNVEPVTDSVCEKTPGTVLAIDEFGWKIAAADGVVKISDFQDEFGHPISAQNLASQCNIIEGLQLPIITAEQAEWLENEHAQAMFSQGYWSKHPVNFEPCQLSFMPNNATESAPAMKITDYQSPGDYTAMEVLAAWLIYIVRNTQTSQIQIGCDVVEYWHRADEASLNNIFAKAIPFDISIQLNYTFSQVATNVEKVYKQIVSHLPCLTDVLIRYAKNFTNDSNGKKPWELAVSLIDAHSEQQYATADACEHATYGNLMTLLINKENGSFKWIYNANQIAAEEVDRISSRLLVLLASGKSVGKSEKPISKLDLLTKDERELVLNTWNEPKEFYSSTRCVQQLFELQVKRDGKAIALECNGETLSYAELNAQANRVANYLLIRGCKLADCVGICIEHGIQSVIAMLGVVKTGACYIPLDPTYPTQWLVDILQDTICKFLLVDATGEKLLGSHHKMVVDMKTQVRPGFSTDNPDPYQIGITSIHCFNVTYPYGFGKKPVGICIDHTHVQRYIEAATTKFEFTKQEKWAMFHTIGSDISTWEVWGAWLSGCPVSIVTSDTMKSAAKFYDWICSTGVTVLCLTPTAFKALIPKNITPRADKLRYLFLGRETLNTSIVKDWNEIFCDGQTKVINMYGPNEATIFSTSWIYDNTIPDNMLLPIGGPLYDKRIYLLDANTEPVPLGVEGELYIGGTGVTRGYFRRREPTNERFITDPFSDKPNARMYRTGDRARYLPDGNLVFLGRNEHRVKIRGYSISVGEIEAHLLTHHQVHSAVVLPHLSETKLDKNSGGGLGTRLERKSGRKSDKIIVYDVRLVAYVVTDSDGLSTQDLRDHLSKSLPDHMIPAGFIYLPSLPLTPDFKVDRRALPAPDEEAFAPQQYESPRDGFEEKLANIWRKLFGIERISRHANFFALGGNSLLAVQLLEELRKIGVEASVKELFESSTLAILAANLDHCDVLSDESDSDSDA